MIVVLPFCSKDADLMRRNLEWCLELDRDADHTCLLAVEEGTYVPEIAALAKRYFRRGVFVFNYVKPPSDKWPDAPNWAWQNTARFIYGSKELQCPWLWMEPDVTPLVKGWLDEIEREYCAGGKPFMGHVLAMAEAEHMNGVAVYPKDALDYSPRAMMARAAPWDVVLSQDALQSVHRANALMAHAPRFTGLKLSVIDWRVPQMLEKRGAVVFHGCNDGTLIELLSGGKPEANGGKIYGVKDLDAKFDEAEVHWQKECGRLSVLGQPILPWKDCRKKRPSVLKQTSWDCGIFQGLEISKQRVHFNPGIVTGGEGQIWLVTRRWDKLTEGKWHSTICAYKMNSTMELSSAFVELRFGTVPVIQHEDPRVIWHDGHFHVAHCVWEKRKHYAARMAISRFTADWKHVDTVQPNNGKNNSDDEGSEKNWIWFLHGGKWHFVYSFCPHVICRPDDPIPDKSPDPKVWKYGEIRGGTPPVLLESVPGIEGPQFLTFFHSSLPWKKKQRRYYMGAYMFEAIAPFRVTAITPEPLLVGSEEDSRINGGPLVVFPCGTLLENDQWLVTFGVNDEACGWIKIPNCELQQRMVKCT